MASLPGTMSYQDAPADIRAIRRGRYYDTTKAALDFVLAIGLWVALTPVLVVCVVVIKLSSRGPAILRQVRLGKDGRKFRMYKFRTMQLNAEAASGPVLASADDERVVPTCRWMRRSHLDELPQLLNVIRGEMSLVGPRPERPEIAEQVYLRLPEFRHRLQVRPGITGLAQVRNGYDTCIDAFKHKLQYDLEYIRRRGLLMELGLLLLTVTKLYDSSAR